MKTIVLLALFILNALHASDAQTTTVETEETLFGRLLWVPTLFGIMLGVSYNLRRLWDHGQRAYSATTYRNVDTKTYCGHLHQDALDGYVVHKRTIQATEMPILMHAEHALKGLVRGNHVSWGSKEGQATKYLLEHIKGLNGLSVTKMPSITLSDLDALREQKRGCGYILQRMCRCFQVEREHYPMPTRNSVEQALNPFLESSSVADCVLSFEITPEATLLTIAATVYYDVAQYHDFGLSLTTVLARKSAYEQRIDISDFIAESGPQTPEFYNIVENWLGADIFNAATLLDKVLVERVAGVGVNEAQDFCDIIKVSFFQTAVPSLLLTGGGADCLGGLLRDDRVGCVHKLRAPDVGGDCDLLNMIMGGSIDADSLSTGSLSRSLTRRQHADRKSTLAGVKIHSQTPKLILT